MATLGPNSGLMRQTVTRAAISGVGSSGDPTYAATETRRVRQQSKQRVVRSSAGLEMIADTVVYDYEAWTVGDRIWLHGDDPTDADLVRTVYLVESSTSSVDARTLYKITIGTTRGMA